jgi:hypothetical protein
METINYWMRLMTVIYARALYTAHRRNRNSDLSTSSKIGKLFAEFKAGARIQSVISSVLEIRQVTGSSNLFISGKIF